MDALQVSLKAQLSRIAEVSHTCVALNDSTDLLRKSLRHLTCVVEMIEDRETREELKIKLQSADLKLLTSILTLTNAKLSMERAGEHGENALRPHP